MRSCGYNGSCPTRTHAEDSATESCQARVGCSLRSSTTLRPPGKLEARRYLGHSRHYITCRQPPATPCLSPFTTETKNQSESVARHSSLPPWPHVGYTAKPSRLAEPTGYLSHVLYLPTYLTTSYLPRYLEVGRYLPTTVTGHSLWWVCCRQPTTYLLAVSLVEKTAASDFSRLPPAAGISRKGTVRLAAGASTERDS